MTLEIPEVLPAGDSRQIFAILGNAVPPRDPDDDEEDEDEEQDDEDSRADEPPVVREPDED
ncbi:hypothetical protein [Bradyrhizobium sp. STM 3557]|uniref:hypothetical protein n=1 Tax=Bradyrhizobium sp. STM 3557 TaxID=578920 RepID=UPI00388E0BAD